MGYLAPGYAENLSAGADWTALLLAAAQEPRRRIASSLTLSGSPRREAATYLMEERCVLKSRQREQIMRREQGVDESR